MVNDWRSPVEAPFRRIDIGLPKNCAHIFKAESE